MMKILIIKLGAIGDVIRTTSILSGLKKKHNCDIDWATKKESYDILKNDRLVKNIYLINDEIKDKLKKKKYDLVISLDDEGEACGLASYIAPNNIIGAYLENGAKVYTADSSLWFDMGLISRFGKQKADEMKAKNKLTYQEIMYKILDLDYKKQEPILSLNKKELDFGKRFAERNKIKKTDVVIGINTGAGGRWQDKKLSEKETAELIDKLGKIKSYRSKASGELKNQRFLSNSRIILFGGPEEVERNERIKKLASQKSKIFGNLENSKNFQSKAKVTDAGCGNSLMEFASLVNLCSILVTSDSLALHIGTALKKKIVCFFYPTSSQEIELYGRGVKIIGKGKDYCSYKPKCDYPPKWDVGEIVRAVRK